jgi:SAM-dependent methyltransferase
MRPLAAQSFDPAFCFVVSLRMDVVDLRNFYAHPLGTVARRFIGRGVRRLWTGSAGLRVLGIGYATPYLGLFREDAERCLAFMPAAQGVVKWPSARPTLVALVDESELPLPDAAIDRVLLVHALELSNDVAALLREVWRVLAAGGRILAVVPNRRGVWARMDTTPFGQGRPYSRSQLTHLLRETWFTPTAWGDALYVPPIDRRWFLRSALAWERTGATMSAPFAGVHLVEATKQVYRAIPVREKKLVPTLKPVLKPVLAPSPGGAALRLPGWDHPIRPEPAIGPAR